MVLLTGCMGGINDDGDAESVAESFAKDYFNYNLKEAQLFCTPESERWIRFAASNIYEADVERLRGMDSGADVELIGVDYTSDTTAVAVLRVDGALVRDTIGSAGHVVDKSEYRLTLVKRGERWLVRMASLPRSEK